MASVESKEATFDRRSVLSAALQIHSVEAHHASSVRLAVASQAPRVRSISQCPRMRFWKPVSRSSSDIQRALRSPFVISIAHLSASAPLRHSGVFPAGRIYESSWPQGAKMRQKSGSEKQPAEDAIKDIRWRRVDPCREEDSRRAGGASREGALPNEQTIIFRGRYPDG